MPKSHTPDSLDPAKNPQPRQAYNKPVLSRYGPVKDLTTSGSQPNAEAMMGMNVARRD